MEYNYKYYKPTQAMDKAIATDDKGALKTLLVGIIGSDPTFATSEYSEAINYIKRMYEQKGKEVNLAQEYVKQDGEYKTDNEKEWTKEYFGLNLVWLRDNFCVASRKEHIIKVGSYAYRNSKTMGKMKKAQFDNGKKQVAAPTTTSGAESTKWWLWAVIAVSAVILIIVLEGLMK